MSDQKPTLQDAEAVFEGGNGSNFEGLHGDLGVVQRIAAWLAAKGHSLAVFATNVSTKMVADHHAALSSGLPKLIQPNLAVILLTADCQVADRLRAGRAPSEGTFCI